VKRNMLLAVVCALMVGLVSCLDFDEQEIYAEHDQKADRLLFLICYRGLYQGAGDAPATEQLEKAVQNEGVALLSHWPFSGYLKEVREQLAAPPKADDDTPAEIRKDALALLGHIKALQGGFFVDLKGRLCGSQVLIIEKPGEAIPLSNRLISAAIIHEAQKNPPQDEQGRLALDLARKNHVWVSLKGQSIVMSMPMPEEQFAQGREQLVANLIGGGDYATDALRKQALRDILSNPVFVWHEDSMLSVKVGVEGRPWRCVTKPALGKYQPNLMEHVKDKYGLHLEENIVKYLSNPDAPAQTEAEQAAKLIAPRLKKTDLVLFLVRALKEKPSEALRARLRAVPLKPELQQEGEVTDDQRLALWENWLRGEALPRPPEKK